VPWMNSYFSYFFFFFLFFILIFLFFLLSYNQHIALFKFKVYNVMIHICCERTNTVRLVNIHHL